MRLIFYFIITYFQTSANNNKKQPTLDYYLPQNVTYNKKHPYS
jgi:hypothetical protein